MTADLGISAAPVLSFGALLKRLRLAREATIVREYQGRPHLETHTLSQQELARRAGLDAAVVNRAEANLRHPTRETVLRLAGGLELGESERVALLVAAGYWPWTDLDQDRTALVLAVATGVVAGDYRRLVPPEAHKTG